MTSVEHEPEVSEGNGAPSEEVAELVNKIKDTTQKKGMVNVLFNWGIDYGKGRFNDEQLLIFREAAIILSMDEHIEYKKIGDSIKKTIGVDQY